MNSVPELNTEDVVCRICGVFVRKASDRVRYRNKHSDLCGECTYRHIYGSTLLPSTEPPEPQEEVKPEPEPQNLTLQFHGCTCCSAVISVSVNNRLPGAEYCEECRRVHWKDRSILAWAYEWVSRQNRDYVRRKRSHVSFDIESVTPQYLLSLWKQQEGLCALSSRQMTIAPHKRVNNHQSDILSVDRIDSRKGYVAGNIQLVCLAVNAMKSSTRQTDFIKWCEDIARTKRNPPADCIAVLKRLGVFDASR
jgi:hypothetical protein